MGEATKPPRGRLRLQVRTVRGEVVAERSAENIVLRRGAAIVANLLAGKDGTVPIDTIQVGFGTEVADAEATALTPPETAVPPEALRSPVEPADFTVLLDRPDVVQVAVATLFQPTAKLENVSEAGLLAGDQLYNQVVFEPVTLDVGQDVTFFWEIDFPFGR